MIRIGTRGSELALWQANHVAGLVGRDDTELIIIKTQGDRVQDLSFDKMEGKGFFTKEIEQALLERRIDCAVHSMKDLPTEETPGLTVAAVLEREDPADVLLIRADAFVPGSPVPIKNGAAVGTSSLRRQAQILALSPAASVRQLRGNVPTRVRKLRERAFDAVLLAAAGLNRLAIDCDGLIAYHFSPERFLPAPAQGALALQVRAEDRDLAGRLGSLNHPATERAVSAERHFLSAFGGGCHIPLGAYASAIGDRIRLAGLIATADGICVMRDEVIGTDPQAMGEQLAEILKSRGACDLL